MKFMLKEGTPIHSSNSNGLPEGQPDSLTDTYLAGDGAMLPALELSALDVSTDFTGEVPLPRMGSSIDCEVCSASDGTCALLESPSPNTDGGADVAIS